jgi:peptidoglycan/LPS O-acetylase OafA/YrhL
MIPHGLWRAFCDVTFSEPDCAEMKQSLAALKQDKGRFVVLDSWRGIAALLVMLFHMPFQWSGLTHAFIRHSYLFVDFFFVLSGFVLSHAVLNRPPDGRGFIWRRIGRLWPLHAAILLGLLGLEMLHLVLAGRLGGEHVAFTHDRTVLQFFSSLSFISAFGWHPHLIWNDPSWSIAAEFWVSGLFALFIGFSVARRTLIMVVLALASGLILFAFSKRGMDVTYDLGLARCLYGFGLGTVAHALFMALPPKPSASLGPSRLGGSLMEILVLGLVVLFVTLAPGQPMEGVAPVFFILPILVFARETGIVSQLLRHRLFVWLGALSYSIYLLHMPVLTLLRQVAAKLASHSDSGAMITVQTGEANLKVLALHQALANDALAVAGILIVIGLSILSLRFVETPGQRLVERFGLGKNRSPNPTSSLSTRLRLNGRKHLSFKMSGRSGRI